MFQEQRSLSLSKDGVSKVQELQMTTQTGDNTHVIAIDGNFDDAQTNVKHMFNDVALREKLATRRCNFHQLTL